MPTPAPIHLRLTFRKLLFSPHSHIKDGDKVRLTLQVQTPNKPPTDPLYGVYNLRKEKTVRNSWVNFYGQTVVIVEQQVQELKVGIVVQGKMYDMLEITYEEIETIDEKTKTFTTVSDLVELYWQAVQIRDSTEMHGQGQRYEDRSLEEDFHDMKGRELGISSKGSKQKRVYSPKPRAEERKRMLGGHIRKRSERLELVSESPHKLTNDTYETVVEKVDKKRISRSFKFNKKQLQKIKSRINVMEISGSVDGWVEKIEKKQQQQVLLQEESKLQQSQVKEYKVHEQPMKISQSLPLTMIKLPKNRKLVENQPPTRRKLLNLIQKIDAKTLIYTTIVGLIGGLASHL